jgi:hypothetical protein
MMTPRFTILALLVPTLAAAEPTKTEAKHVETHPLWEGEIQIGYGISKRASEEMSHTAVGPLSFAALAAIAINQEPYAYAVGGLVGETLGERSAIGVTAGARLVVPNTPLRVTGTGVLMVPKTLWGVSASAGACWGKGTLGLCGDIQLTAYVAGAALPKDELELQVAFVLGVVSRGGM